MRADVPEGRAPGRPRPVPDFSKRDPLERWRCLVAGNVQRWISCRRLLVSSPQEDGGTPDEWGYNLEAGGWAESTGTGVVYGTVTVTPSTGGREASCEGSWDAGSEACVCSGNTIGVMCFTLCDCCGHGTQHAIEAARAADSCGAGSCACEQGYMYHGEFCAQGGAGR